MFKPKEPQYFCKEIPNVKLELKNEDNGTSIEIILDTLTYFYCETGNNGQFVEFEAVMIQPEDYIAIIQNHKKFNEIKLTVDFIFQNTDTEKTEIVTYPPFNKIAVTKELTPAGDSVAFKFKLYEN